MFAKCTIKRDVTVEELKELLMVMEEQETTDRIVNCSFHIVGNYATIDVDIDEDGNVTLV